MQKKMRFLVLAGLVFSYHILPSKIVLENNIIKSALTKKPLDIIFKDNQDEKTIPVVIIGSGPAGLSAGLYMGRTKIPTVIFAGDLPGGQLMLTGDVENWPGVIRDRGSNIISILEQQTMNAGTFIVQDTVTKVDFSKWPFKLNLASGDSVNALSIIIATGSTPKKLNIPGEKEYWGNGVSSCAVCDCTFFKDKEVVVVGGGDSAVENALQLAGYAKSITILVRKETMRAAPVMQDKLQNYNNIKIVYNNYLQEICGNGEYVTHIILKNALTSEVATVPMDGVFLAIGYNPNTDIFKNVLSLDRIGYIEVDKKTKQTSVEGVFAAGDVEDYDFRQAVVAGSSGCQAHFGVVNFLHTIGWSDRYNTLCWPNKDSAINLE